MQRITITLDDELAAQFEQFRSDKGYANRSEAVRDLLRDRLARVASAQDDSGHCYATLTYVFDHNRRELAKRMTQVSHHHHDLSVSTLHVHLDHDHCLETVVLRGAMDRVRRFADQVAAQPGVRHAELYLLPVTVTAQVHAHGESDAGHRHEHAAPIA